MKKNYPCSIAPLHYQYSYLHKNEIPNKFITMPVNHRKNEIEQYEVIFFHRLLKNNYGEPSDIEWQDVRIGEKNGVPITVKMGKEWKYYLKTDLGNIIQAGTENNTTSFEIGIILYSEIDLDEFLDETKESEKVKDAKKFIDSLLKEAKHRGEKFDLNREIEQGENLAGFMANNLFWSNYACGELMIEWLNRIMPEIVKEEFEKFKDDDFQITSEIDLPTVKRLDKYLCAPQSFLISGFMYYYMAIEAFINLIYDCFLLDKYRYNKKESKYNLEVRFQRLDIDIKLIIMPKVCQGFKVKQFEIKSETFSNFRKLTEYRNIIIHGNVMDSANDVFISEHPFSYSFSFKKKGKTLFPFKIISFDKDHLSLAKNIADELIQNILQIMDDKTKNHVIKTIINSPYLHFSKDKNGIMRLDENYIYTNLT